MKLAHLGKHVGVDLLNFSSPDDRSIKAALDWMVGVSNGKTSWEYQEINQAEAWKPQVSPLILRIAERIWPDAGYISVLDAAVVDDSNRLNLLWPRYKRGNPS